VDASVFLYAYLKPRKTLNANIAHLKANAKAIVKRINSGERVATALPKVSEVANILEAAVSLPQSHSIIEELVDCPNVLLLEPTRADYLDAVEAAKEAGVGLNDAVAYVLMKKNGISEVYSFDKHFDQFKDLARVQE